MMTELLQPDPRIKSRIRAGGFPLFLQMVGLPATIARSDEAQGKRVLIGNLA